MPVKRNLRLNLKKNANNVITKSTNPIEPKIFGEDSNSS